MVGREGGFSSGIAAGLSWGKAGKGSQFCGKSWCLRLLAIISIRAQRFFELNAPDLDGIRPKMIQYLATGGHISIKAPDIFSDVSGLSFTSTLLTELDMGMFFLTSAVLF